MARGRAAVLALLLALAAAGIVFRQAPPPAGIRDRVAPAGVPAGPPVAIVAFGSSLTARALWPGRLGAELGRCGIRAAPVTVRATAGAGSAAGLTMIGSEGPGRFNLALVEFAVNDADLIDGVPLAESRANHREIIARLRARHPGIAIVLMTTNPVTGLQRLKRPKLMAYADLYPELAAAEGVSVFDGTARWVAAAPPPAALPDGLHPDPETEAALYAVPLARLIAEALGHACAG